MIKELYQLTMKETALSISQSKIDAVMKKKIVKSGCRVYKDGLIGIAGTLGEPTDDTWKKAEENLNKKIAYPYEPEKTKDRVRDMRNLAMSEEDFVKEMEELISDLHREFPDFLFSNKVKLIESEVTLKNDTGLKLVNYDKCINLEILVKHVDSIDIFDTGIMNQVREYSKESILNEVREMLLNFRMKAEMPKQEKLPVIMTPDSMLAIMKKSLNGETIGQGTSIFCDKMNKKVFHDDLTIYQDYSDEMIHTAFFDMEGVTNEEDKFALIENGIIKYAFTDKKQANKFSYPLTGAAGGDYDEVPSIGNPVLSIKPSHKTLKELLNGELGVLVIFASGGDYTPDGNYGSPVQMAYLTDGEKLLGRLPEFNISGSTYDIFGEDYIGVSSDKPYMGERALVVRMNVSE